MADLRRAANLALDLLFPPKCAYCGGVTAGSGSPLCPDCIERWLCERKLFREAGKPAPPDGIKRACHLAFYTPSRKGEKTVADVLAYSMKQGKNRRVYPFAALSLCAELYKSAVDGRHEPDGTELKRLADYFDVVSYLPRSRKNAARYGVDQSRRMAEEISRLTGIGTVRLFVNTSGKTQHELSAGERRENMSKLTLAQGAEECLAGKHLILVDDIVTTGASVSAAANLALGAGAKDVTLLAPLRTSVT